MVEEEQRVVCKNDIGYCALGTGVTSWESGLSMNYEYNRVCGLMLEALPPMKEIVIG